MNENKEQTEKNTNTITCANVIAVMKKLFRKNAYCMEKQKVVDV